MYVADGRNEAQNGSQRRMLQEKKKKRMLQKRALRMPKLRGGADWKLDDWLAFWKKSGQVSLFIVGVY